MFQENEQGVGEKWNTLERKWDTFGTLFWR